METPATHEQPLFKHFTDTLNPDLAKLLVDAKCLEGQTTIRGGKAYATTIPPSISQPVQVDAIFGGKEELSMEEMKTALEEKRGELERLAGHYPTLPEIQAWLKAIKDFILKLEGRNLLRGVRMPDLTGSETTEPSEQVLTGLATEFVVRNNGSVLRVEADQIEDILNALAIFLKENSITKVHLELKKRHDEIKAILKGIDNQFAIPDSK